MNDLEILSDIGKDSRAIICLNTLYAQRETSHICWIILPKESKQRYWGRYIKVYGGNIIASLSELTKDLEDWINDSDKPSGYFSLDKLKTFLQLVKDNPLVWIDEVKDISLDTNPLTNTLETE